ncbi:hypothetical protein COW83_00760 [Candidatus Collierbacteria bacterium CG22_combo_CG10-13_8_21_14_all_43_12]|uniref:Bax inhibitor-1/YccA family protein n=1 Tax=Candidatus Collierbacteria bacterium CG22_combo_CG10-13_8_21_14_all_43_12 TaxID=1974537 RepID=A0A2H0DW58_9BACT|nr:hypothetical protein [bacterium]PIP86088.1 MAG: hypothetical protein COW83_00760 [Candidatus Collierbacteria bacterium CG22_combo_CG10-13_8_21_14_all_43_12]
MFNNGLWERTGYDVIEKSAFIRLVAFFTAVSIGLVAVGSFTSYAWVLTWPLLIVTFIGMLGGALIFSLIDNPMISGFGVALMSISAGLMIGPVVATYQVAVVLQAILITGGIVVTMSVIGIMFPDVFIGFGPYLLAGLTLLIFASFAQIIFIALGFEAAVNMPILAWIGIGIFTLYVAYDWSRALSLPLTVDNAIDAAGAITLDAINLFLRILQILGSSKSSSSKR